MTDIITQAKALLELSERFSGLPLHAGHQSETDDTVEIAGVDSVSVAHGVQCNDSAYLISAANLAPELAKEVIEVTGHRDSLLRNYELLHHDYSQIIAMLPENAGLRLGLIRLEAERDAIEAENAELKIENTAMKGALSVDVWETNKTQAKRIAELEAKLKTLEKEIAAAPGVFAVSTEIGFSNWSMNEGNALFPLKDTHRARLIRIEKLEKND